MYQINCFAPISQTHIELSIQINLLACRNYNCKQEEKRREIQYLREILPPPMKLVAIFIKYMHVAAIILPLLIRSFPIFSISATTIPIETNIKDWKRPFLVVTKATKYNLTAAETIIGSLFKCPSNIVKIIPRTYITLPNFTICFIENFLSSKSMKISAKTSPFRYHNAHE